jgi:hypothetical protein
MEDLTKEVLSCLFLFQNTLQKTFEFRLLSQNDDDPFIAELSARPGPTWDDLSLKATHFFPRLRKWNEQTAAEYNLSADRADKIVLLTSTRLSDNYYYLGTENWAIIALGGWEDDFAPPSLVEYFLTFTAIASLNAIVRTMDKHFDTRGCVSDFNASLGDARQKVLTGHICHSCRRKIEAISRGIFTDADILLKRTWLGSPTAPSDIALTVKKLGYDLFHTAGAKPSWRERWFALLEQEGLKNLLNITGQILLLLILLILGLKK